MKFFVQSANLNDLSHAADMGLLDGVLLCRSDVAAEGSDYLSRLAEVCAQLNVPVSAEVISADRRRMVREAESLCEIAPNIMVKLPTITPGVKACRDLSRMGHAVHMTLCYRPTQAMAAAKAGAALISLHVGQFDAESDDAAALVRKVRHYHEAFGYNAELLASGIERPEQLPGLAAAGADAAAISFRLLEQMITHPLTETAVREMMARWHAPPEADRISA